MGIAGATRLRDICRATAGGALLMGLLAAAMLLTAAGGARADDFYTVAAHELDGAPGSLIRAEQWPVQGIYRAKIYRILYRSKGLEGEPIAVSGAVIIPEFEAPAGGRHVVAWGHPTTGVTRHCAPTLTETPFNSIAALTDLVAANFVVVATDYPGLGTAGVHPYLIGESAGRAVLDSIRAVRAMPEANAGPTAALWGHSQGGHAVLWAGQLAHAYAPEIHIAGIAAAAPATELALLLDEDEDTIDGKILLALAIHSWSRIFGYSEKSIIRAEDVVHIDRAGTDCVDITSSALDAVEAVAAIRGVYLTADPAKTEPWKSAMTRNSPGGSRIGVPVLLAQGDSDEVIDPHVTRSFAERLCAGGEHVSLHEMRGVDHSKAAHRSAKHVTTWLYERFAGKPVSDACQFR